MKTNHSSQEKKGEYTLQVLNPTAGHKFKPLSPAARLKDLNNKKIGLHWNTKARGDVALTRVKEVLTQRYAGMTFESDPCFYPWPYVRKRIRSIVDAVPREFLDLLHTSYLPYVFGCCGDDDRFSLILWTKAEIGQRRLIETKT